jgi:tetratricopeptide (TPR) repeat protein
MSRVPAICVLLLLVGIPALAQTASTASPQESTSLAQPDAPPSPPDAPIPDVGTQTSPPPPSKAKKVADKFDPRCMDVIFHVCWSSPAAPQGKVLTAEQKTAQQASEDIEVGYFYMNKKNYRAAESRLQEAAELKPDAAAAWVGLAQAQQKLGKNEAARQSYEEYLKLIPDGAGAEQAKKAMAELKNASN